MTTADGIGSGLVGASGRSASPLQLSRRDDEAYRGRLLGRWQERRRIDALLDDARAGRSAVLVMRGEAGIGKTALLEHGIEQASEFRVLRVAGVESEMELPFAAVHQLLAPMLDRLDALPEPQRSALRVAFGLSFGDAPDRFRVALAVLGLTAEVAADRPLLCLVDDAQWLDAASAQVLGFVARRLVAESVAMVIAARPQEAVDEFANLPELAVTGLSRTDAKKLLRRKVRVRLDDRVLERLVTETAGNPLALLELASAPTVNAAPTGYHFPWPHELSGRIEQSFLNRLEALDDDARRVLLIAAAEPTGDPVLLWRSADRLGVRVGQLPAETATLLTIGERVAFRHPLVRSAVYRAASPDERRSVHLALAHATDPEADGDRRAWHLAAAARAPDEEAASELERSAGRAQARGGFAAAAAYLQRSVALSGAPRARSARALAAARASLRAGAFEDARTALTAAQAGVLDELQSAQVELLRGQIAFAAGSPASAARLLLQAAGRLEPLDPALARETYLSACGAAMFGGPASSRDRVDIGRAVQRLPPPPGERRATDLLLDGVALLATDGRAAAAPALLRARDAFQRDDVPVEDSLRWGWIATAGSSALWDDDGMRRVCERVIPLARDAGALEHLPIYLLALATVLVRGGEFAEASSLIAESDAVAEVTGTRLIPYRASMQLAALRGREPELSALTRAALDHAARAGQGGPLTIADWAQAVLLNGLGRYDEALEAARRATSGDGDPFAAMRSLPELVEAATRVDRIDLAQDALERLVETTQVAGTDYGLGIEARSRALLAEGRDAEDLHAEAIERLRRTKVGSELARAHLLHGEALRRHGRRRAARAELRTAHGLFVEIGMEAFAERARRELLATGETVRGRSAELRDELTPQEEQIAGLAGSGLTNPEIAARLFLSPRTVEWHLKNVFSKLGIRSRRELRGD